MKTFIRYILVFTVILYFSAQSQQAKAQNVGLSFSFFFPKNGEFSTPISPFSFRGVGFSLNRFVGVESGFTLYRMAGMSVKDLPFEPEKSILGPNFTLLIPLELVLTLPLNKFEMSVKGGGFGFYPFGNTINHGNLDRALATYGGYEIVNSTYEGEGKAGFGIHFGSELVFYVTESFGLSFEGNYFLGGADFPLTGSYLASSGGAIEEVTGDAAAFPDAKIDFTGLELSIGIIMSTGGGQKAPKRRR